ncbi:hypothetical protein SHIRM173S_00161 [Streptomyces hirsutus]
MREYITVLQTFFRNEVVSFDGEFVQMQDVRFDSMYQKQAGRHPHLYRSRRPAHAGAGR